MIQYAFLGLAAAIIIWLSRNILRKQKQIGRLESGMADLRTDNDVKLSTLLVPLESMEKLTEDGWARELGTSPHFEILRRTRDFKREDGTHSIYHEYLILCPTFLAQPVYVMSSHGPIKFSC